MCFNEIVHPVRYTMAPEKQIGHAALIKVDALCLSTRIIIFLFSNTVKMWEPSPHNQNILEDNRIVIQ